LNSILVNYLREITIRLIASASEPPALQRRRPINLASSTERERDTTTRDDQSDESEAEFTGKR